MSESAALVPVPLFFPVRTDTGAFSEPRSAPGRRPRRGPVRGALPDAPAGGVLRYDRHGGWLADPCLGRYVNRYA